MDRQTDMNPALHQPERLLRYMPAVQGQRQELRLVEAAWDNLALLSSLSQVSSQASSVGDLARARRDFAALSDEMTRGLAGEALKNALDELGSKAQMAIDVLVRNLFERTADIGFFATDVGIAEYLSEPDAPARDKLEARLREYANKYTVYENILVFDHDLTLQAALQQPGGAPPSPDEEAADLAFLRGVKASAAPYTEHYGVHAFCGTRQPTLLYAQRVRLGAQDLGVLCLQFKFADENVAIFGSILNAPDAAADAQGPADHSIALALVDAQGLVLDTSDTLQLPMGMRFAQAAQVGPSIVRHLGHQYLMVVRETHGFQGYTGPGWRGLALLSLELAFESQTLQERSATMRKVEASADFLSGELRTIPTRSAAIQSALDRSVWNGLLDLTRLPPDNSASHARDVLFAKTLLSEIGATAHKTAHAFAASLHDLQAVVMQAMLRDAQDRASLAMQILDRNLYERANDCRWWALTPQFATTLAAGTEGCPQATEILAGINALYTVYRCIVLFDAAGTVLAVSDPAQADKVGQTITEPWAAATLRLTSSQHYAVSDYAPSAFYGGEPTLVFAAAVRADGSTAGPARGGVAVVWDAGQQLDSILSDCASGSHPQDALAFVDRNQQAICAHGNTAVLQLDGALQGSAGAERLVALGEHWFGTGEDHGQGYREFRALDHYDHGLRCVSLRHLCAQAAQRIEPPVVGQSDVQRIDAAHRVQLATFSVGSYWLAVEAQQVSLAAPDTTVLAAGNLTAPFLGMASIAGKVYPVVDLRSVVSENASGQEVSLAADPQRQLIVIRLQDERARHLAFALRVDALGAVLDVDSRTLQITGTVGQGGAPPFVDAVVAVDTSVPTATPPAASALLCRVSSAWLHQCGGGAIGRFDPKDLPTLEAR